MRHGLRTVVDRVRTRWVLRRDSVDGPRDRKGLPCVVHFTATRWQIVSGLRFARNLQSTVLEVLSDGFGTGWRHLQSLVALAFNAATLIRNNPVLGMGFSPGKHRHSRRVLLVFCGFFERETARTIVVGRLGGAGRLVQDRVTADFHFC